MNLDNRPHLKVTFVVVFAIMFAITTYYLFKEKEMSGKGQILEIFGGLLAFSAFVGDERIREWELAIKEFADVRLTLNYLKTFFNKVSEKCFDFLAKVFIPLVLITLIAWNIRLFWLTWVAPPSEENGGLSPFWLSVDRFMDLRCLCNLIFGIFLLGWKPVREMLMFAPQVIGMVIAFIITTVLYIIFFIFTLLSYTLTTLFLLPYVFTDNVSTKLKLRPTIGVLGAGITLLGAILQRL